MAEIVTLEISEEVAERARVVAAQTNRRFETVLSEWLGRMADELPLEALSDEQILTLCDMQMSDVDQQQLSELLAANREGNLSSADRSRLDELMGLYRRGLVRKAQAWKIAVERGLRSPLN